MPDTDGSECGVYSDSGHELQRSYWGDDNHFQHRPRYQSLSLSLSHSLSVSVSVFLSLYRYIIVKYIYRYVCICICIGYGANMSVILLWELSPDIMMNSDPAYPTSGTYTYIHKYIHIYTCCVCCVITVHSLYVYFTICICMYVCPAVVKVS